MINTLMKSCNISYGICQEGKTQNIANTTTSNLVILKLTNLTPGIYCYVVTASDSASSVIVEGQLCKHKCIMHD